MARRGGRVRRCGRPPHKVRFADELAARVALATAAQHIEVVRVYRCAACRGWHLTSQPTGP